MPTERLPHRGQCLVRIDRFTPGAETLIERRSEYVGRDAEIDGCLNGPAPSPESATRPENLSRSGSWDNDAAVRSNNQDDMTLPRRQTSATSSN